MSIFSLFTSGEKNGEFRALSIFIFESPMRGERALEGGGVRSSLERLLSLPLTITTLGEQRGARACDPHITRTASHLRGSGAVLECVKNFLTTSKKKKAPHPSAS